METISVGFSIGQAKKLPYGKRVDLEHVREKSTKRFQERNKKWKQSLDQKVDESYSRGNKVQVKKFSKFHKKSEKAKEKAYSAAAELGARSELLLPEESGCLEADENSGEKTYDVTQAQLKAAVDVSTATKSFSLSLKQFGPYRVNYSRNGRYMLLGGGLGHVAALDWPTKKLMCEFNVMETVNDVQWLHNETMFAVAQKRWVHMYDNQGVEVHCLKALDSVLRLHFLPHHFLLTTTSAKGYVSWLDVSVGRQVAGHVTHLGRLDNSCVDPTNGVLHVASRRGTVSLWSPNVSEPLVKIFTHRAPLTAVTVDTTGRYMCTAALDKTVKVWDMRSSYAPVTSHKSRDAVHSLGFSQRGLLAAAFNNHLHVFRQDFCASTTPVQPYLINTFPRSVVSNVQFCPYEDVLGVGHQDGFTSLLVPGAGEPNFDALEANPYQSKKQRREAEVKMLLEKVQPEMITLQPSKLGEVNKKSIQQVMEEKKKLAFIKAPKIEFEPRHRTKGRSSGLKNVRRKQGAKEMRKKKFVRQAVQQKEAQKKSRAAKQGAAGKKKTRAQDRFSKPQKA